jgi:hypothetical protein
MTHIVLLTLALFASFSCTKSKDKSEGEGDGTANPSTSSGTNSTNTGTDTETSTGSDSELSLSAPASFIDGDIFEASSDHYTLSWSAVDNALSYEVAVGTSSGATDVLDWQDVGNNTSVSTSTLSLPDAGIFYASVRAVGANDTKGDVATGDGWQHLICPTNWVRVPGSTTAGLGGGVYVNGTRTRHDGSTRTLSDFCVMKYEMKLHDGTSIVTDGDVDATGFNVNYTTPGAVNAVSDPTGRPWVRIQRLDIADALDAERACSNISGTSLVSPASLDNNFHLINNAQWQAIARDIENNSTDNTNAGVYNRGNSDGDQSCDATFENVGNSCADNGATPHINKRTHTLTNGEVIWDIAGNVWEWVIDDVDNGPTSIEPNPDLGVENGMEYSGLSSMVCGAGNNEDCFSLTNRLMFGPNGSSLTSSDGIGYFYGGFGSYGGAAIRGGFWDFGSSAGLFFANLSSGSSFADNGGGARCVWAP